MTDGEQLAAIAATLNAMDRSVTEQLREIKAAQIASALKHDAEVSELYAKLAGLKAELLADRERLAKWENRGAGILIAIGSLASLTGAVAAILWETLSGVR